MKEYVVLDIKKNINQGIKQDKIQVIKWNATQDIKDHKVQLIKLNTDEEINQGIRDKIVMVGIVNPVKEITKGLFST